MMFFLAVIHLPWVSPVVIHLAGLRIPVHLVFDLLAYSGGFQIYLRERRKVPGAQLNLDAQGWLFLGCVGGALIGAKVLAWAEYSQLFWALRNQENIWLGGKTIIGGLLGGWIGIEIVKKGCGIRQSTGDAFVWPLIYGIAVGRFGCFLTGLPDLTCGLPTALPWAVDFGDGIGRHPAQLYEITFLLLLGVSMPVFEKSFPRPGGRFRTFMAVYLSFRFVSEFYKPNGGLFLLLSPLQWACLFGAGFAIYSLFKCPTVPISTMN